MNDRGRYSHGRDKDERFMHYYNEGWQWWWLYIIALFIALIFFLLGWFLSSTQHHDKTKIVYQKPAVETSTSTVPVIGNEPVPESTTTVLTTSTTVAPAITVVGNPKTAG